MKYLTAVSPKNRADDSSDFYRERPVNTCLILNGLIKSGGESGFGKILITERSIFFFHECKTPVYGGGLVGVLLAAWMDKRKASQNPPAHLEDPEIAELDTRTRSKLVLQRLCMKLPLNSKLISCRTREGFSFAYGEAIVHYIGWMHKRKIANFLESLGLRIESF
jgi:hypothetical protein